MTDDHYVCLTTEKTLQFMTNYWDADFGDGTYYLGLIMPQNILFNSTQSTGIKMDTT